MILDLFGLQGKVALVTGSNTGLGQGVCRAYAEAGAKVVGVSRRPSTETEEIIGSGNFYNVIADLSSCGVVPEVVEKALARFGRIDILVNNAGIIKRCDSIDVSEEDWDSVLNVNLKTVFFLTQAVAKQFVKQGQGGKVINIASINVNAIAPGYMATNNTEQLRKDGERSADILARIPAGRWGTPADLEGAAVYLASAASDYVNGFTLAVDGGWLGR